MNQDWSNQLVFLQHLQDLQEFSWLPFSWVLPRCFLGAVVFVLPLGARLGLQQQLADPWCPLHMQHAMVQLTAVPSYYVSCLSLPSRLSHYLAWGEDSNRGGQVD